MDGDATLPVARLTSEMGHPEEIFSFWRESIGPFFDSQALYDVSEAPPTPLQVSQYHLGNFLFYDTIWSTQKFIRDKSCMAQHDDADHVLLQTWINGRNEVQNGDQDYIERPGNVFAVNLAYEIDATCEDSEVLTLALSREWLSNHLPHLLTIRGKVFQDDWSMGVRIFNDYMLSLRRNLPNMKSAEAPMLNDNILAMLESLITYNDIEAGDLKNNSVAVICSYIDQNLANPDLGVEAICKHFRCSRSTLFRLFKPHGGVREFIQRRRLMGCFKKLTSPVQSHRQIFDLAMEFGFINPSHFSALFKRHFGMTPKEVREAGAANHPNGMAYDIHAPETQGLSDPERMRLWAKTLKTASR